MWLKGNTPPIYKQYSTHTSWSMTENLEILKGLSTQIQHTGIEIKQTAGTCHTLALVLVQRLSKQRRLSKLRFIQVGVPDKVTCHTFALVMVQRFSKQQVQRLAYIVLVNLLSLQKLNIITVAVLLLRSLEKPRLKNTVHISSAEQF